MIWTDTVTCTDTLADTVTATYRCLASSRRRSVRRSRMLWRRFVPVLTWSLSLWTSPFPLWFWETLMGWMASLHLHPAPVWPRCLSRTLTSSTPLPSMRRTRTERKAWCRRAPARGSCSAGQWLVWGWPLGTQSTVSWTSSTLVPSLNPAHYQPPHTYHNHLHHRLHLRLNPRRGLSSPLNVQIGPAYAQHGAVQTLLCKPAPPQTGPSVLSGLLPSAGVQNQPVSRRPVPTASPRPPAAQDCPQPRAVAMRPTAFTAPPVCLLRLQHLVQLYAQRQREHGDLFPHLGTTNFLQLSSSVLRNAKCTN